MRIGKATAPLALFESLPLILSLLIVLGILFGTGQPVLALAFPGQTGPPHPPQNQTEFEAYLQAVGRPVFSRIHGYLASYSVYANDQLLVYGTPQQIPNNLYDSRYREFKYLGLSYDETPVTNSKFPDTSATGETYSTPWQWQEQPLGLLAEISWARLTARQQELIRSSDLEYRRRTYGGMSFSALGLTSATTEILAQPSWHLGFVLYTRHYLPGTTQIRYATLTGPGSGDIELSGDLIWQQDSDDEARLCFDPEKDQLTVRYQLTGSVSGFLGLARSSDIAFIGIASEDGEVHHAGSSPVSIHLERIIDRDFLAGEPSQVLTVPVQVWAVSQMGDIRLLQFSRTLTIMDTQEEAFTCQLALEGSLDYFKNRKAGQLLAARDEHRYLGLERVHLHASFSSPPDKVSFTGFDQVIELDADGQTTKFKWDMEVPVEDQTLDWENRRLSDPLSLSISGQKETPAGSVSASDTIYPVEITGDVYDIYRVLSR